MRQKFLHSVVLVLISMVFAQNVNAQTVEVISLSKFSTEKPTKTIVVKTLEDITVDKSNILTAGTVIKGNLTNIASPKRLKRNAGFTFKPTDYTDLNGRSHKIKSNIVASYTQPIDKAEVAKSAALGVGSFFVKGLSVGVAAVSGAVKNEEGNRLKSSAVSAYEASPISYVEKGEDIYINPQDRFYLKFLLNGIENDETSNQGQNYSYTIEKE